MNKDKRIWHLGTLSEHNNMLYESLLYEHHLTSETLKEVEFDGCNAIRGYFAKKARTKYFIDELLLNELPIRIGKEIEELKKDVTSWDATVLEDILRPLTVELGLSTRKYFGLLRTATTGKIAAPPLFQTMAILGKEKCFQRLNGAIDKLNSLNK